MCAFWFRIHAKLWAHTLRHPCLACPSRCTEYCHSHNNCKKTIIPQKSPSPLPLNKRFADFTKSSKSPTPLPPLSKGGGLTARHKLSLCCIFTCDTSAFFIHQTFCRQDGGIAIPPFAQHHIYASLVKGEVLSPEKIRATTGGIALHHQPFQNRTIPRKSPPPLPPLEKGEVARLI